MHALHPAHRKATWWLVAIVGSTLALLSAPAISRAEETNPNNDSCLGSIAAGLDLQADRATLKRSVNVGDALPMRMVKSFGDAQDGSQASGYALVQIGQRRVGYVMAGRLGLAIVIAHQRGHHRAVPTGKAGNVPVQREIFAVLVMPVMADGVTNVVKQSAGFEKHARLRGQVMRRL